MNIPSPIWVRQCIEEFDGLGWHRTGTPGDQATTDWLLERLALDGVEARSHTFTVPRVTVVEATISVGGRRIQGHPQFDAGWTGPAGVEAPLKLLGDQVTGTLAVIDLEFAGSILQWSGQVQGELKAALERCEVEGAAGAIVIWRGSPGSIVAMNAPRVVAPSTLPVLFVAPAEADPILEAADRGGTAALMVDLRREDAMATNVVARLPATTAEPRAPLVVLTPKSGWFHCAAERGGGIAVWLWIAHTLSRRPERPREVVFLATSGHELGHFGLEAYLSDDPDLPGRALTTLHLGASIGAAFDPGLRLIASDEELFDAVVVAANRFELQPLSIADPGAPPVGEAVTIARRGGRFVTLAGLHAYFHTPEDRPDKVDVEALARYAAAMTDLVTSLLRSSE